MNSIQFYVLRLSSARQLAQQNAPMEIIITCYRFIISRNLKTSSATKI